MARIRNIKPEFFMNDELADLEPVTRLFYIGLWTQADREGRMKYRPKRLKAILMPYDDCEIESMVASLTETEHVLVYEVAGKQYLQVQNFSHHQSPNVKEQPSTIPAPCKHRASTQDRIGEERIGEEEDAATATRDIPEHADASALPAKPLKPFATLPDCMSADTVTPPPEYAFVGRHKLGASLIGYASWRWPDTFRGPTTAPEDLNDFRACITNGCFDGCPQSKKQREHCYTTIREAITDPRMEGTTWPKKRALFRRIIANVNQKGDRRYIGD